MFYLLTLIALADDTGLSPEETALPDDGELVEDRIFMLPEGETIIVTDESEVAAARLELTEALTRSGYEKKRARGGRTVYVAEAPWKPKVIVDEDGWMLMRRRPVVLTRPDLPDVWFADTPLEYLTCVVAPPLCVRIGGLVISDRKLNHRKAEIMAHAGDELNAWSEAKASLYAQTRLFEELPAALDTVWYEGLTPEGESLPGVAERKAWILELWMTRTDNDWGDAARGVVEDFMAYVIQASNEPFTEAEIAAANARRTCRRELHLPEI